MRLFKDPRLILTLIVSLSLLSAEVNYLFPSTMQDKLQQGKIANILLIGTDARPGELRARSDTVILVSLNKALDKVALVSIPRDTRINFRGTNLKINMINQLNGPQVLCQEVSKLLNTAVNHYMMVNFTGFEEIIDALGGVYVDVDIHLQSYSTGVFLHKGYQRLTGKQALAYVRFRNNPDMDIARVQRQQKLLTALASQVLQKENLPNLPRLIPIVNKNVSTNIDLKDMLYLGAIATKFDTNNLLKQTLPGYHYWAPSSGASFWEADREIAQNLLEGLFTGRHFEVNRPAPPWVNSW